jgi:hypothetical protein
MSDEELEQFHKGLAWYAKNLPHSEAQEEELARVEEILETRNRAKLH